MYAIRSYYAVHMVAGLADTDVGALKGLSVTDST